MQCSNDTFDSGFSGGGFADVGAIMAGLQPIHAVEYDPAIASCYRANIGNHIEVAPIQEIDWTAIPVPFWRHMSPVCTRASQANANAEESSLDIAMAQAVARSIAVLPPMFSLENVWQYRNFESFKIIYRALQTHGYDIRFWHLNSADYGVPQTRKRLILVASRIQAVRAPQPTHTEYSADSGQLSLFHPLPSWIGWYEAIADLVDTLPPSEFAPWQLERLPEDLAICLIGGGNTNTEEVTSKAGFAGDPSFTVFANKPANQRAFILSSVNADGTVAPWGNRDPSFTIGATQHKNMPRAFVVDGQTNDNGSCVTLRQSDAPMYTISASGEKRPARAFLMRSSNSRQEWGKGYKDITDPVMTVTQDMPRAWLEHGRVVRMTPRALMRFQSIPDWYKAPQRSKPRRLTEQESAWLNNNHWTPEQQRWIDEWLTTDDSLTCTITGNGVPPLLLKSVIQSNL